ncbi:MAG: helix-turn-helix domain-containing protein [Alphaproteobacteria bacterium]|nr:helix-turn-helix domain-containing protein [Alphaproteobacteria bacterium]MBF0250900.1 helix-turn-helix domain-containing protein [Alphaproteobacteria bacterium]
MIWMSIVRAGTVVSLAAAALQLYDHAMREIKPNRIYTTREAARFLGIGRRAVIELIKSGQLTGKLAKKNYRIPGQSILDYLSK